MYLEFMRRCKYLNIHNKDRIQFMMNCLLEVYALDGKTSYTLAFGYIRQMAMHLRTALTNLTKEKIQAVYNWQFLRCLEFWGKLLCLKLNAGLESLIYPLIQVALGSISLQKSPQYFPFHLQAASLLNEMSLKCGIFIPLSQFLVTLIEDCETGAKKNTMSKMMDLKTVVKVTKSVSQSRIYKVTCF